MKYAIIESGGKQYRAVEGGTIEVDLLPIEIGSKLDLDIVLLVSDGENTAVGSPTVSGANVKATVVDQFKAKKIIVFKYHPRKRYRLKRGHRQKYTRLQIEKIEAKGFAATKPAKVEAKPKKAKAPVAEKVEAKPASGPSPKASLADLGFSSRNLKALESAEITTAGQLIEKLKEGDKAALAISGFGPKGLEEAKTILQDAGYSLT